VSWASPGRNEKRFYHLVTDVIDRVPGLGQGAAALRQHMSDQRLQHRTWTRRVGDDAPDVRDWVWPGSPPPAGAATKPQRGQPA
jgi:xylulose-5-phosphate/fructose-6-phosphate phosphoketolase